jgi:putative membrane protein
MFGIGYCGGMGVAGWALMVGFWLAVIGLVIWALTRLFPSGGRRSDIEAELDRRLASGELDAATYQHVRDELTGAGRR